MGSYEYNCIDGNYYNDFLTPVADEKAQVLKGLLPRTQLARAGEIVVSSKKQSVIGTTALDTCWGIIFYDRKNKMGMVGHGLPSSKQATLLKMINMLGSTPRIIEYRIIPGYRNYEDVKQLESE